MTQPASALIIPLVANHQPLGDPVVIGVATNQKHVNLHINMSRLICVKLAN